MEDMKSVELKVPRVGVGVFLVRDGKVLLGQRRGAHGSGSWSLPGGHLEFKETLQACAVREVQEETGVLISDAKVVAFTNDIFEEENRHYITIFLLAVAPEAEPQIMEPDRCLEWRWCDWSNLPQPLFIPIQNLLKQGFNLTSYL